MSMLTIYECPTCRHLSDSTTCRGPLLSAHPRANGTPVRVFREEDVRPLVTALRAVSSTEPLPENEVGRDSPMDEAIDACHDVAQAALDAFPAPEEWK